MDTDRADELARALRTTSVKFRTHNARLLAELGLHPGQDALLLELADRGPRTQSQLAAAAGCEPPTVTLMVRRLTAAGMISRSPSAADRRAVVIDLTEQGRALVPRIREVGRTLVARLTESLRTTSVAELSDVLLDLEQALRDWPDT